MTGSVVIDRVRCRYRVPARHPAPAEVRARLDRLLHERVPAACGELLGERLPSGPGVVVIRRLDLKLVVSRRLHEPRTAELWARAIALAVSRALAEGSGDRVVRFDTEAARVARLVEDLAAGTAWTKWYHESFSPLRGLGSSGAIRRVLIERPASIAETLRLLRREGRLRAVLDALAEHDGWAVFEATPADGSGPSLAQLLGPEELRDALAAARPPSVALRLLAELAVADAVSPRNVELARHLAHVAPLVLERRRRPATPRALLAAARARGDGLAESLRLLLTEEPELLVRAVEATAVSARPVPALGEGAGPFRTDYGGVFLLLPTLAELDLEARLLDGGIAPDEAARAAGAGRWLVLLKCLGTGERLRARYDPGLVVAAGLESAPDDAALRSLGRLTRRRVATALVDGTEGSPLAHFGARELLGAARADAAWSRVAAAALALLARRLPGFEQSSPGHLARNLLAGWSTVEVGDDGVVATLPRAPLEVVLRVGGWADSRHEIPWLPGCVLLLRRGEE